jgi:hypothetical protein
MNWGAGRLQIDFSIDVLCASAPPFARSGRPITYAGECDDAQCRFHQRHVEGEAGYECTGGGDCA